MAGLFGKNRKQQNKEPAQSKPSSALRRSLTFFNDRLTRLFSTTKDRNQLHDAMLALLIEADFGPQAARDLCAQGPRQADPAEWRRFLHMRIAEDLRKVEKSFAPLSPPFDPSHSTVIFFLGVNGSGKTTSLAKLAHRLLHAGRKPLLAGADTFRAAAVDQLHRWGERLDLPVFSDKNSRDPASIVFRAITRARESACDTVLIDTAGRLQNKHTLMQEVQKMIRVAEKASGHPPDEVLLTLDASVGQNALSQLEHFKARAPLTGLLLAKMDGASKGGILYPLARDFALPVYFLGLGENINDLHPFCADEFAAALFATDPYDKNNA